MKQKKDRFTLVRINRHVFQYQLDWLNARQKEKGIPSARTIRDALDTLMEKEKPK